MSPLVVLFILRVLSALLLLGFLAVIGWFLMRDLRAATVSTQIDQQTYGALVDVSADLAAPLSYPLVAVTSIGRHPGNSIQIDNGYISAEHALLSRRGSQWWLEDLGSRNGTVLNRMPITGPVVVSQGDIITLGDTSLRLDLSTAQHSSATQTTNE
jgi:pSer/pThr/pTyr-binding forkhead associated (FHA) protein